MKAKQYWCGIAGVRFRVFFFVPFLCASEFPVLAQAEKIERITVGYVLPSAAYASLFVAKEAGILEKYGLDAGKPNPPTCLK